MVIPAFWNSLHDETVYPEPDRFLPERWLPQADGSEPLADSKPQNYIIWGSGPHKVSHQVCLLLTVSLTSAAVHRGSVRIDAPGGCHRDCQCDDGLAPRADRAE